MPLVRAAAHRSLALDPSSAFGHAMLGLVASAFDHDWNEVEQRFKLALADSPIPGLARWPYANFCLAPRGCFREAAAQMEQWLQEDPLNVTVRAELAFFLNHAGMHDRAADAARLAVDMDGNYWFGHYTIAEICAAQDNFAEGSAPWKTPIGWRPGILGWWGCSPGFWNALAISSGLPPC
jgi:tetratricopeptide (TPR) repeat protein